MADTQHTATPWHRNIKPASKYPVVFSGRNTHVLAMAVSGRAPEQVEADLEFLLRAVNNHAALVEALKSLTATARTFRNVPKDEQEWTPIDDEALDAAFKALEAVGA